MIFAIIGRSGTGKSTIAEMISNRLNLENIISYTTRPKRTNEIDGIDYNFISKEQFLDMNKNVYITALKHIPARDWYYGYDIRKLEDCKTKDFILVVTPDGYNIMKEILGEFICSILIETDGRSKIERSLKREPNLDVYEMCRRYLADEEDYKDFKGDFIVYNNGEIGETVSHIEGIIRGVQYGKK